MATIEALPILFLFLLLISYGLGYWGIVHTGILNSIAARTYAFETFRNRTDLSLFRDANTSSDQLMHFRNRGVRFHGIKSEDKLDDQQHATARPISFARAYTPGDRETSVQEHNEGIYALPGRNRRGGIEVSPAWIMIGYGICLNARCGP